jgi:hypothetical protein
MTSSLVIMRAVSEARTAKRFCEHCFYRGDESEFLDAADFCIECMSVHARCPKCKASYHSVHVSE